MHTETNDYDVVSWALQNCLWLLQRMTIPKSCYQGFVFFLKCSGFVTIINCKSILFIFVGHYYLYFLYTNINWKSVFFIFVSRLFIWKFKVCELSKPNIKTLSSNFNPPLWLICENNRLFSSGLHFIFLCENAPITWYCYWNILNINRSISLR